MKQSQIGLEVYSYLGGRMQNWAILVFDHIVFACVELWGICRHNRLWRKYLRIAQKGGRVPCLSFPRVENDKFYWRKTIDHNPDFVTVSDKLASKDWAIKAGCTIPSPSTLWSGESLKELPKHLLGEQAILKSNNSYGQCFRLGQPDLTFEMVQATAKDWFKLQHWKRCYEIAYKYVTPQYLVEQLLKNADGTIVEIKFLTYGSRVVRAILIESQNGVRKAQVWDLYPDGRKILSPKKTVIGEGELHRDIPPDDTAIEVASLLGSYFDHIRVDLYLVSDRYYLGELTVYDMAGMFSPVGLDLEIISITSLDLRRAWFFKEKQTWYWEVYKFAYLRHATRVFGELDAS